MIQFNVSLWPVLLAAVSNLVLGSLWYGPLFGKQLRRTAKLTKEEVEKEEKKEGGKVKMYLKMFVGDFVMAYILAIIIVSMSISTFLAGAMIGFLIWFGFLLPMSVNKLMWHKDKASVEGIKIHAGYHLTVLVIVGALLAIWL